MEKHIAWSTLSITKAAEDGDRRVLEGIATTPTPDRAGDIVVSKGAKFKLPIPFLSQHNSAEPIGHVVSATVKADGISVRVEIAKNSGLDYVERAWLQIKAGLVRGLSIGFRPDYKEAEPIDPRNPWDGFRFKVWEWLELSAVTIPANAEAGISTIKAYGQAGLRVEHDPALSGRSAVIPDPPSHRKGSTMSTLQERHEAAVARLAALNADMEAKQASITDENEEEVAAAIASLAVEITKATNVEAGLRAGVTALKGRISTNDDRPAPARGQTPAPGVLKHGKSKEREPAELLFKAAATAIIAARDKKSIEQVVAEQYASDNEYIELVKEGGFGLIAKTATGPATTTGSTWAANLVQTTQGEFMDLLQPISAFGQLVAFGSAMPDGTTKIPFRNADSNALRGAFLGEGDPIPVRIGSIGSQTLGPKKMGVITSWTRELMKNSTPAIEQIARKMILDDTAVAIDTALVDAGAATVIRPAGLMNGVTPTASPTGAALVNMIGDIKLLVSAFPGVQGGRRLVFLMNESQALALAFATNAMGGFAFPDITQTGGTILGYPVIVTNAVPAATVIVVDAQSFVAINGAPEFDISEQATLHFDDGTYQSDQTAKQPTATVEHIGTAGTPNVVAAPVINMFQTASFALRMLVDINWALVRTGAVAAVNSIDW